MRGSSSFLCGPLWRTKKTKKKTKICFSFRHSETLGKMVTLVTTGTIGTSTKESEGTTRQDPSFLRAERRKRARAAKCCLDTTAQLETRCLDKVQYSPGRVEGPVEKTVEKVTKRAGRRDRHRAVVQRREVEQGLFVRVVPRPAGALAVVLYGQGRAFGVLHVPRCSPERPPDVVAW